MIFGLFAIAPRPILPAQDVLGGGGGLDHVMVVVRNLEQTGNLFRSRFGFNVAKGIRFPDGLENTALRFRNGTYVEFLGIYDKKKAMGTDELKMLRSTQGATGFGLNVSSADMTARQLRQLGFNMLGPESYPGSASNWMWKDVGFATKVVPGGEVFFIEYNEALRQAPAKKKMRTQNEIHPNGAIALRSLWIAVPSLETALKKYEALGFSAGRRFSFSYLHANAKEVNLGRGKVLLLESTLNAGPVTKFLQKRGENVIGLSIGVANLTEARRQFRGPFKTIQGPAGPTVLLPTFSSLGLFVEITDR